MRSAENYLRLLRCELAFVEAGGYRSPVGWRWPRVFEGSPTCQKGRFSTCTGIDCPLRDFVPSEHQSAGVPCRHIPLDELGETIGSLYRTGTNEEIEESPRNWLRQTIGQMEEELSARNAVTRGDHSSSRPPVVHPRSPPKELSKRGTGAPDRESLCVCGAIWRREMLVLSMVLGVQDDHRRKLRHRRRTVW
jgi:hypothetical protein